MLSSHYRSPVDFSDDALEAAHKGWSRLWNTIRLVKEQMSTAKPGEIDNDVQSMLVSYRTDFVDRMDDDFNAPAGLATLQELTRDINSLLNNDKPISSGTLEEINSVYQELAGDVLGLIPDDDSGPGGGDYQDGLMRILIELRTKARESRDWSTADMIRDQLEALGIILEDRSEGTIWKEK